MMRSISIGWTVTKIDSAQREKAERSWLFSVFSGMGHEENPKAETRNPKEVRNPKSEPVGLREAGSRECDEPELRLGPLRASAVGFLSDFGLRNSSFDHELVPLKVARNQEDGQSCSPAEFRHADGRHSFGIREPTFSVCFVRNPFPYWCGEIQLSIHVSMI
jgi:hypothetical protein